MTTNAIKAQGVALKRGDGATPTEVFTLIAEITDFTGPQQSSKPIEVTSLDSTAHEYIAGLQDGGQVSFNLNYVPSNVPQQGLLSDFNSGLKRNFQLILTDGATTPTKVAFAAVVIAHQLKGQVNDRVTGSATLKITGAVTFTYGS